VPVEYQDYKSAAEETADLIADNKIAELAELDDDMLASLMAELDAAEFDVELTGHTRDEAAELQGEDVPEEEDIAVPNKAFTKAGYIYELGPHRLMCGDGTSVETIGKLMAGDKAELVFTDPPYNVDYGAAKIPGHKIRKIQNDKQAPDAWKAFNAGIIAVLKAHSAGDIYIWGASGPEGMKQRLWLHEAGVHWSATIIWKKQQMVLSPANYQRIYEPCFYGWIDKSSVCEERDRVELWEFDRPIKSDLHPTMKPLDLCAYAIRNSSKEGAIVLDMFGGSGSTLIAADMTGRSCRMVELDPLYCDVIVARYKAYCIKKGEKPVVRLNGKVA
jgi:DNA modification methylase